MPLGQLLLEKNLLDASQLREARAWIRVAGGSLAEGVVALGFASGEAIERLLAAPPRVPESVDDTGLDRQFLLNFLLKAVYVFGLETSPQAAEELKLPEAVLDSVFEVAKRKRLVEVLGLTDSRPQVYRYALSSTGRQWAIEALQQCQYAGPAPVPLAEYQAQVLKQSIAHERVRTEAVARSLRHLVLPEATVSRLGPALNSGKAILFYGAAGNGKTSIAEALGGAFEQTIYVPYCVEVDGQIIKVHDPAVHESPTETDELRAGSNGASALGERAEFDARWMRCRRPVVVAGGELTMEMLDLTFDPVSKYYEAPSHIKAVGGVFIIDDFGRQRVRSRDILNRWIIPLERRVDYLTLHTGKKLQMPFDELVVFSTNLPPRDLMDDAALRRIPYKFHVAPPTHEEYETILRRLCDAHGLTLPDDVLSHVLHDFYPRSGMSPSGAHPRFIIEHVVERCQFEGIPSRLTLDRVREALQNLVIDVAASTPEGPPSEGSGR